MTDAIFTSMRAQMRPSAQAQEELMDRLAGTQRQTKKNPIWKFVAVAACAALAVAAYPAYRAVKPNPPALHSYVTVDGDTVISYNEELTVDAGGEGDDAPNTGVIDVPAAPEDQEEALAAYDTLMEALRDANNGAYPDWYGGAYLDPYAGLIVNVTSDVAQDADKEFYLNIQTLAGSDQVTFGEARYSLNDLRELQERVDQEMRSRGVFAGSGVDERTGRLDLYLTRADEDALALLAELDRSGDAIRVMVAAAGADEADDAPALQPGGSVDEPFGGSVDAEDGGEMPLFDQVDEDYVDDSELDLDAEEPVDVAPWLE